MATSLEKETFWPREDKVELPGLEVPYLSIIGALMYLANYTQSNIAFTVRPLERYISSLPKDIRMELRYIQYLREIIDMGMFYPNESRLNLIGYADTGYLFDPHKGRSQTGYLLTYDYTIISWWTTKQTLVVSSSNHVEILAIHDVSRECVRVRSMTHTKETYGSPWRKNSNNTT